MKKYLRSPALPALRALSLLALLPTAALADDQMLLRIRQTQLAGSNDYQLLQVQRGNFQPQIPLADPRAGNLIVIGRDAQGKELFRRLVRSPDRLRAEVFDPATGHIVQSKEIQLRTGVMEVHVPQNAALASIDLVEQPRSELLKANARASASASGKTPALARDPAPVRRFDLQALKSASDGNSAVPGSSVVPSGSEWLWQGGQTKGSMDLVLIGDGYAEADQSKWKADAKKVADGILADPQFAKNKNRLNILRVDITSPESGVSEPGVTRQTALGTVVGCYDTDRMVCTDADLVYAALEKVTPPDGRDVIIVVANTTTYGGTGGFGSGNIGTMTMHEKAIEISLHEIGHTAFDLADEYEYGTCLDWGEPTEVNVTQANTKAAAKWGWLIGKTTTVPTPPGAYPNGTVGLFEGGQYCFTGVYRPTETSRMRALGYPWHIVNERRIDAVFAYYDPAAVTTVTVSGQLAAGGSTDVPLNSYQYSANGGTFKMSAKGPANTNFSLQLYKWNGSAWAMVAESTEPGSNDQLSHVGTKGYYYGALKSIDGSGVFTLRYDFPK